MSQWTLSLSGEQLKELHEKAEAAGVGSDRFAYDLFTQALANYKAPPKKARSKKGEEVSDG